MKLKKYYIIDAVILIGFLVAQQPHLTGISLHEWLSVALAGIVLAHLLMHWRWVVSTGAKFFSNLFQKSRLNLILDILLFAVFSIVMVSGLMMSRSVLPVLNIQAASDPAWRMMHSASASAALILAGLHFILHWKWIVSTTRRLFQMPSRSYGKTSAQGMAAQVKINHQ